MKDKDSVEGQDLVKQASADLPSPEKLPPTAGKVYWKDVKSSDVVIKLGATFYVQDKGIHQYQIYWNGQEASAAIEKLGKMVKTPALKEDGLATDPLPTSSDEDPSDMEAGGGGGPTNAAGDDVTESLPDPTIKASSRGGGRGISYEISPGRSKLVLRADDAIRAELKELKEQRAAESEGYSGFSVADEQDALDGLIANSELEWVNPEETGDLTSAPMLGVVEYEDDGGLSLIHI